MEHYDEKMSGKIVVVLWIAMVLCSPGVFAGDEVSSEPVREVEVPGEPAQTARSPSLIRYAGALGLGYNTYNGHLVSLDQFSLVTKFSATYRNANIKRMSLTLNAFITALPFNSTTITVRSSPVDVTFRHLGVNLRLGYDTPWLSAPWKLIVNFGWYYATSIVTNGYFGYVNAGGPQLFPSVSYELNNGGVVSGYLKFSPILNGLSFVDNGLNFEGAVGFIYLFPGKLFNKRYTANLDIAHFTMNVDSARAISNSYTLGMGLIF